jgi:hypothetical protein
MSTVVSARAYAARIMLCMGMSVFAFTAVAQNKQVFINEHWPIRGRTGSLLSPPNVEPTNECSQSVYVDSIVPKSIVTVRLNGVTVIGGPVISQFGFDSIPLTAPLHVGDKITATQRVNGVTSAPSAPMIVGQMPTNLPAPTVDHAIYACGRTVPVHNLIAGVKVKVEDLTAAAAIGSGATPNLWGSDWDPVFTSALVKGHQITASQSACTGIASPPSPPMTVMPEPSPLTEPKLDSPIVGNDVVTAHKLFTGSVLRAFQPAQIGSGLTTGADNWMSVAPPIKAAPGVSAEQDLCTHSPRTPPQIPVTKLPPPILVGPICPGEHAALVENTTINATLVLLKNGAVVGYGGAASGDVPIDLAPPATFINHDTVKVVEYIGTIVATSNSVVVGCTSIVTYHNNSERTGWNSAENTLTTANVRPATFGHLVDAPPLDDQIDAQPLIVANQPIENAGTRTVVYVATESNTIYAIDSWSAAILKSVNLGAPVPMPLGCGNNGPNVGIDSTPTIDLRTHTLYVIAYTLESGQPTYKLHALDLGTLLDKPNSPVIISASHTLADGTVHQFDASVQRQRPALLEANGNIYAGFGSFCDFKADQSRGWVLGWNAGTLAPLVGNEVTDTLTSTTSSFLLSSVWMSGYGLAAAPDGHVFFVTGNSDPGHNTYTGTTNIQESVVQLAADLSAVTDLFTPADVFTPLDQNDTDYGSGGAMVLPTQPGPMPNLVVAAGKEGNLFILNRDPNMMGGFHSPNVPNSVVVGECWCGPSFFSGADGVGRVVTSGATDLRSWMVNTALTPALTQEASASLPQDKQDGGFFTSISSHGTTAKSAIIWAVDRPGDDANHVSLYAFDAAATGSTLTKLWSGAAGTWPNLGGNANIVPTVANGRVYVASYQKLSVFGLRATRVVGKPLPRREPFGPDPEPPRMRPLEGPTYWGTIREVDGAHLVVALRTGKLLEVDLKEAIKQGTSGVPVVGRHVLLTGKTDSQGRFIARTMMRAKGPASWGVDRSE